MPLLLLVLAYYGSCAVYQNGRLTTCSLLNDNSCITRSQCSGASAYTQSVCCEQIEYTCPSFWTPYPNSRFPQKCNIGEPWQCGTNQCMPSNVLNVNICCQSTIVRQMEVNLCPVGWELSDNVITYCSPLFHTSSCPGFSSCLRSAAVQHQFVCCVPMTDGAIRDSCINAQAKVELIRGEQRRCLPYRNNCSDGFSCQPSKRNRWLCCSMVQLAQAQFACPIPGQQPVLNASGGNRFCSAPGQQGDCPQNSLCLAARNVAGSYICCRSSSNQGTLICSNGGMPQPSSNGYQTCSTTSFNECDNGYSCVRAANNPSIQLCCSTRANKQPICPNKGALLTERGRPVYCSTSQPQLCPAPYSCQSSVGAPNTFICCSSTTLASLTCPVRYVPSLDPDGNQIFCSPTSSTDCPGGSNCLQSSQTASVFLCCRDESSPRVCPNNQDAYITPGGTVETCNAPGAPCSEPGYTCQLSIPLAQYVCCGHGPSRAVCADGRDTYEQIVGQTYTCDPLLALSACPYGYECSQSTVPSISVCCATNAGPLTPSEPQCPIGWSSYRNDIDHKTRSCNGPLDMSCPIGFSCAASSSTGQFLCCRMTTSMRCARGQTFLANNHPRLCNRNRVNQCPRGYFCEQSTNPSITICCGAAAPVQPICPNGRSPALLNGFVRSCPVEGQLGGCPSGNVCQRANTGLLVCCPSFASLHNVIHSWPNTCPESRCRTSSECSHGFQCTKSDLEEVNVCCQSEAIITEEVQPSPVKAGVTELNDEDWVVVEG